MYHDGPSNHPYTDSAVEIYAVLREDFQHLQDGQAISLIPDDTLLTTQQAAEMRRSGFSGQPPSLTSEAGHRP